MQRIVLSSTKMLNVSTTKHNKFDCSKANKKLNVFCDYAECSHRSFFTQLINNLIYRRELKTPETQFDFQIQNLADINVFANHSIQPPDLLTWLDIKIK